MIKKIIPTYTATNIKVLKGLDAVKKRPGMYIGNTEDGSGLHHMVYEILDNCVDEAIAGYCTLINIVLHEDGSVTVSDNGRGMPIDIHKEEGMPAAELIMTVLHSGGKFDKDSYTISGGLHGVGVSVVNALSKKLFLTIKRDGLIYVQEFNEAFPNKPIVQTYTGKDTGTSIRFYPSEEIFHTVEFKEEILQEKLSEMAFLNQGIKINLAIEKTNKSTIFYSEVGLVDFIRSMTKEYIPITEPLSLSSSEGDTKVSIALMWSKDLYRENIKCYTNNIPQMDGGTHLIGFKAGITRAVNNYIEKEILHKKYKTLPPITGEDVRSGLTAIISVHTPDPRFSSQTKDKLVTSSIRPLVESVTSTTIFDFFMENRKIAEQIVDKIISSSLSREAARKARDLNRQTVEQSGIIHSLSGKLAFCQDRNPENIELFLVEGESAGGSAKQARQRKFQAILPLKGKILNVEKSGVEQMLKSSEILNIITALGTGIGERFNVQDSKYHKIIIMTDADIDGRHIETLLLTFFYRHMKPLIEKGYIYIAQPPLYSIKSGGIEVYLKDDKMLEEYFSHLASKESTITSNKHEINNEDFKMILSKYSEYMELKKGFSNTCNEHIINSLLKHNLYNFNHQEWWKGFLALLNTEKDKIYSCSETTSIAYNESGVERSYDLNTIFKSDMYLPLFNAYKYIANFDNSIINVQYRQKDYLFNNIFSAIDWLLNHVRTTKSIKRYKGLGEMNPDQLWVSTMNPINRRLLKVTIEDAAAADILFNILMGSEVHLRRDFIIKYSKYITFKV